MTKKNELSLMMATKIAFDSSANIPINNRADIAHAYEEAINFLKPLMAESAKIEIGDIPGTIICDRHEWIVNAVENIESLFSKSFLEYQNSMNDSNGSNISKKTSSVILVTELGLLLGFISKKILGQYDVGTKTKKADSLFIVEPNIIDREIHLNLSNAPFRLWILTHELTHRIQFIRFPWLRDYYFSLIEEIDEYVHTLIANKSKSSNVTAALNLATNTDIKLLMQKIQAMMSFIEGHADFIMFEVGKNLPKFDQLKPVFSKEKQNNSFIKSLIEKLLGLEMKRNQYKQGLLFVSFVSNTEGIDFLNDKLNGPMMLPSLAEIENPGHWIKRVI